MPRDRSIRSRTASSRASRPAVPSSGPCVECSCGLQRLLAPEPAALFRLLNRPPDWLSKADVSDLQQSAEEFSAAVSDSATLVERIRLLQEELIALINEQTNQTLFILTVVTVLALPLTIIPGMFGMNVRGIPFSEHDAGFWLVLLVVTGVAGLGAAMAWKRYPQDVSGTPEYTRFPVPDIHRQRSEHPVERSLFRPCSTAVARWRPFSGVAAYLMPMQLA